MITQKELKEKMHYDPETGIFTWISSSRKGFNGKVAGSLTVGYIGLSIDHVKYYAHRLAFLYMVGYIPKYVDHIDLCRTNNRWSNLREATSSQNHANYKKHSDNSSGYKGVSFCKTKPDKPWLARICHNYKIIRLGYFETKEEAALAYNKKAIELFGKFANINELG